MARVIFKCQKCEQVHTLDLSEKELEEIEKNSWFEMHCGDHHAKICQENRK